MKQKNGYINLVIKILLFIGAYYLASINTNNPNKIIYYVCLVGVAGAAYVLTEEFTNLSRNRKSNKTKKK